MANGNDSKYNKNRKSAAQKKKMATHEAGSGEKLDRSPTVYRYPNAKPGYKWVTMGGSKKMVKKSKAEKEKEYYNLTQTPAYKRFAKN